MEYIIRPDGVPIDPTRIEWHLLALDPAALIDLDPTTGALRCSTNALAVELQRAFAQAGYPLEANAIEQVPSVCCGGCSG